ncbi:MAG: DMT family transporter [Oscillatoriaceae cyanobacterium]
MFVVLAMAIAAVSTASIFIRWALEAAGERGVGFSLMLAASRLSLAALMLLPAWRRMQIRQQFNRAAWGYALGAGAFLALHFATWITSLAYTSIAASTTLVTTNPIWVSLISWVWFGEKISRKTTVGIAVAIVGSLLIGLADNSSGPASNPLLGNFLALAGSWTVSFYLLLGRESQRRGMNLGSYTAVAYTTAALILLPLPLSFGSSYTGYPASVYWSILLMALLPQLVGHTGINWAVSRISPTTVTLSILFEPLAASLMGYLVFGEVPPLQVIGGGLVLLAGVAVAALGSR